MGNWYTSAIFSYDHWTEYHPLYPDKVTGLHLKMLRECVFGESELQDDNLLKSYIWKNDDSGIIIEPYGKDTKRVETRPAIIVKRGAWTTEMVGFRHNAGQPFVDEEGNDRIWQLTAIPGETEMYFIGNTDGETEALAGHTFFWFLEQRAFIEVGLGFHSYELKELAPLQVYEEEFKDLLATKFTIKYNIWHRYSKIVPSGTGTGD